MACYSPWFAEGDVARVRPLNCGKCWGCRLEHSRQWAVRCLHESKMWKDNCFVTLTYRDGDNSFSLVPEHFTLFMKRLRKRLAPLPIRYFMGGEYGELNGRPHFHACLFNVWFADAQYYKTTGAGYKLYTSRLLDSLWPYGYACFGEVTFESAAYVARYCMKKLTGDGNDRHYDVIDPDTGEVFKRVKEYGRMSLKPGIGATWLAKYKSDVYPHGLCVVNGIEVRPPRYYDKLFKAGAVDAGFGLAAKRHEAAMRAVPDTVPSRLAAKELVSKARISRLKRS